MGVEDDEGYDAVTPTRWFQRRVSARQRLTSPTYWVTVAAVLAVIFVVEAEWGGRWALVPICLSPLALAVVDARLSKRSARVE